MLRVETTLCPSCSRNVPSAPGTCVLCGCATSTSTVAEPVETSAPDFGWLAGYQQANMNRVLDQIERETRQLVH